MAFHILTVLKIRTTEKVVFFQCTETKWNGVGVVKRTTEKVVFFQCTETKWNGVGVVK